MAIAFIIFILCIITFIIFDRIRKSQNKNSELDKIEISKTLENHQLTSEYSTDINKITAEKTEMNITVFNSFDEFHISRIKLFNPIDIKYIKLDRDLCNLEKNFLKYINGYSVSNLINLPLYWTFDYDIQYKNLIDIFISNDFLMLSNYNTNLYKYNIPELKEILRYYKLKISGNKKQLIDRINLNLTSKNLSDFFGDSNKYLILTEKGKLSIQNLKDSATKDLDFEDEVLCLISEGNLKEAYRQIVNRYLNLPKPKRLKDSIPRYRSTVLDSYKENKYNDLLREKIIENNDKVNKNIICTIIISDMMGFGYNNTLKLFYRLMGGDTKFKLYQDKLISKMRKEAKIEELLKLRSFLDSGIITQKEYKEEKEKIFEIYNK